ncbi:hypothetical protein AYI68_g5759 [Smittium mucronatum]|uniref:Uncharacterized protein n=1 Tax=Smittium mucronatum TaxID=133383 RepID=A0A1R0GTI3_9FUNG|nr:hypothetical protein AYI68_g5759 [Smittium mucronatum]
MKVLSGILLLVGIVSAWPTLQPVSDDSSIPKTYDTLKSNSQAGVLKAFDTMILTQKDKDSAVDFTIQPSEQSKYSNVTMAAYSVTTGEYLKTIGYNQLSAFDNLGINRGGVLTSVVPASTVADLAKMTNNTAARIALAARQSNGDWVSDSCIMALVI